jgi:hypothetical protein
VLGPLGLRCETFIVNSFLSVEKCELLGLIVAELVMNAAKHAFPGETRGRVRIEIGVCQAYWRCLSPMTVPEYKTRPQDAAPASSIS